MKQDSPGYLLRGQMLAVLAAGIAVLSLPASAADPASASEFDEVVYSFDGKPGKNNLPESWRQNTSKSFHPLGKVEIIDAAFDKYKKAVRITNTTATTDIIADKAVPAKAGDVFKVSVAFRSPDGKTPVYFGIYPMLFGPDSEYQNMKLKPVGKGWDSRYGFFEIKKPQTKAVRFFISGFKNAVTDFAFLSFRKLRADEIPVYLPSKNLKLWEERTVGANLALRKKVKFYPDPNYALTAQGGTDAKDLTDGKVHRGSGMLHFQNEAVGWFRRYEPVSVMVDLGKVKPVGKGVIRINGGRTNGLSFPKELTVWGSKDGRNFFRGQSLTKLNKLENYLSNFKDVYYLPESDDKLSPTYVYPFELYLNADARYVVFQMQPGVHDLYCDELAVLQADPKTAASPDFNRIYTQNPKEIFHTSVEIRPAMDKMYIAEGKFIPNYFRFDSRKQKLGGSFGFTIDLPAAVEYQHTTNYPSHIRSYEKRENKGSRAVFHFKSQLPLNEFLIRLGKRWGIGPLLFMVKDARQVPENERYVVIQTWCGGKPERSVRLPLEFLRIPEVPPLKRLNSSIWMSPNRLIESWPEMLETFPSVGLNYLPIFPEFPAEYATLKIFYRKASEAKKRFRMMLSPGRAVKLTPDYYCQTKSNVKSVCLAYRGPVYQAILDLMAENVRKYPCDYLTFDAESWEPAAMNNSMQCPRCDALRKKMKMSWPEYFSWAQAEYIKPFKAAVVKGAKAAGRKPPQIGFYALSPGSTAFRYNCKEGPVDFLGGFDRMFPQYTDEAQFCHYGRDTATVHHKARKVYAALKNPAICNPWISGGSGAYYSTPLSNRTAQHVLEAILNGSGGIQFYALRSLESPLDYYYLALAFKQIAPFEDLLMEGSLDFDFSGSNKKLLYTKRDWKGKSLILIGNYEARTPAETTLPLKGKVTDLISGKTYPANGSIQVKIPADDYLLLLVE